MKKVNSKDVALRKRIGLNALYLAKYTRDGFNIPKWNILEAEYLYDLFGTSELTVEEIKEKSKDIWRFLIGCGFVRNEAITYAVRPSSIDEEGFDRSIGCETYLDVFVDDLPLFVYKCYRSAYSLDAETYRFLIKSTPLKARIAVVIQEMVTSEIFGVINPINTATNDPFEFVLVATRGQGKNVLNGNESGSTYYVSKHNVRCVGERILSKKQINKISKFAQAVQDKSDSFVDISFIIKNDIFLQSVLPIPILGHIDTSLEREMLDNRHIGVFPKVVSKLEFCIISDWVECIVSSAYREWGVNKHVSYQLEPAFKEILAVIDCELYLNLSNIGYIGSLLPRNQTANFCRSKFELDMSKISRTFGISIYHKFIIYVKYLVSKAHLEKRIQQHSKCFDETIVNYQNENYDDYSLADCLNTYKELSKHLFNDPWILINQVMLFFEINKLERLINRACPESSRIVSLFDEKRINDILNIYQDKYRGRIEKIRFMLDAKTLFEREVNLVNKLLKNLVNRIGDVLVSENVLKSFDEVNHLSLGELIDYCELDKKIEYSNIQIRIDDYNNSNDKASNKQLVLYGNEILQMRPLEKTTSEFSGIPNGVGMITDFGYILESPEDKFDSGIIISKKIDLSWLPLLKKCSGLIVENGGIFSQIAVVARDLNIPAIFEIRNATRNIADGQYVTLDGYKGEVRVEKQEHNSV